MAEEIKYRILVTGGGGFIGSHTAKRLKEQGHFVRIADWKKNEFWQDSDICHEFFESDLRLMEEVLMNDFIIDKTNSLFTLKKLIISASKLLTAWIGYLISLLIWEEWDLFNQTTQQFCTTIL